MDFDDKKEIQKINEHEKRIKKVAEELVEQINNNTKK